MPDPVSYLRRRYGLPLAAARIGALLYGGRHD